MREDSANLPARVTNHSTRFGSPYPLSQLAYIRVILLNP